MELEGVKYYVKPMNCPMHHKIFAAQPALVPRPAAAPGRIRHLLPLREVGELFGLMRVRSMQMNDAHIYCSESQFEQEFMAVIDLYLEYFKLFGIDRVRHAPEHAPRARAGQEVRRQPRAVAEDGRHGARR
jgi:threonyl-tRNA synthetase